MRRKVHEGFCEWKPEVKRPFGRPKDRWVDNIKMDPQPVGWKGVDCIDMNKDQDKRQVPVHAVMNLHVP